MVIDAEAGADAGADADASDYADGDDRDYAVLGFCTGWGCQEGSVIEHFQEIIRYHSQPSPH